MFVLLSYNHSTDFFLSCSQIKNAYIEYIYSINVDEFTTKLLHTTSSLQEKAIRRSWHSEGQVGGFVKQFENLDLLTVRGSGHMVPQDKPAASLHMIRSFVLNTPY